MSQGIVAINLDPGVDPIENILDVHDLLNPAVLVGVWRAPTPPGNVSRIADETKWNSNTAN
jgi:hypothetical protein